MLLWLSLSDAIACGEWSLQDLERDLRVNFHASSVYVGPPGEPGKLEMRLGMGSDEGLINERMTWWVDVGSPLSMEGGRVLRGGEPVGEWRSGSELRLGGESYVFSLERSGLGPADTSVYQLVVARAGETILEGHASSVCGVALSPDDQRREIYTRVAYWLAHSRHPSAIAPEIDHREPIPSPTPDPLPARIAASSALRSDGRVYGADLLSDGDLATAWCEGSPDLGVGGTLTLAWDAPVDPVLALTPGYHKDALRLRGNAAPRRVIATTDTGKHVEFELPYHGIASNPSYTVPLSAPGSRSVTLEIVEAWPGERWDDSCISELSVSKTP